jgi:hypothetical protein
MQVLKKKGRYNVPYRGLRAGKNILLRGQSRFQTDALVEASCRQLDETG